MPDELMIRGNADGVIVEAVRQPDVGLPAAAPPAPMGSGAGCLGFLLPFLNWIKILFGEEDSRPSKAELGEIALSDFEESNPELNLDLRRFLHDHRNHRFRVMRLECSLDPAPRERFETVQVNVELSPGASGGGAPLAWTLDPRQETKWLSDDTTKLSLGSDLKGIAQVGVERTRSSKREAVVVEAYGVQTASPYWRMTRRRGVSLSGTRPLWVVVQAPLAEWHARATLDTTVRKRKRLLPPSPTKPGPSSESRASQFLQK